MNRRMLILAGSIICTVLVGCSKKPIDYCSPDLPEKVQAMVDHRGGQWVEYGDQIYISFPAQSMFKGTSANLNSNGKTILLPIANRLNCFNLESVKVKVSSNSLGYATANQALGQAQANEIMKYLTQHGVSRLIYQEVKSGSKQTCTINQIEIVTKRYK